MYSSKMLIIIGGKIETIPVINDIGSIYMP